MKRVLLALGGILLLALAVLPYLAGQKTQQALDQWVAEVNQTGTYTLSWQEYHKGWFGTRAILQVAVEVPPGQTSVDAPERWMIPLNMKLEHGPVLWRDGLRPGWFSGEFFLSEEHQAWVDQHLTAEGDGPFYVARVRMNLAGNTTLADRSLPFKVTVGEETFTVAPYQGEGEISREGVVRYKGILQSMNVVGARGTLQLGELAFRVDSDFARKVGRYAVPGSGEITLKSLIGSTQEGEAIDLRDFVASSKLSFNPDNTKGDLQLSFGFASMEVFQEKVEDAELDFSFANMSLTFFDKYMALAQQSYGTGGQTDPQLATQMMGLVASDLLPLGPKISVNQLVFKTPEGLLDFKGSLEIAPEAAQQAATNPLAILSHVALNAVLTADKPLAFRLMRHSTLQDLNQAQFEGGQQMTDVEKQALADNQTQMKLNLLTIQGMLVDKGAQYTANFQFKDGKATLNDKPMPLPF